MTTTIDKLTELLLSRTSKDIPTIPEVIEPISGGVESVILPYTPPSTSRRIKAEGIKGTDIILSDKDKGNVSISLDSLIEIIVNAVIVKLEERKKEQHDSELKKPATEFAKELENL